MMNINVKSFNKILSLIIYKNFNWYDKVDIREIERKIWIFINCWKL